MRAHAFRAEAHRQSLAVAASTFADEDKHSSMRCPKFRDYASKLRPVVVVEDDGFDGTDSITVCPFTSVKTDAPLFRVPVEPNDGNGLRATCRLMVDKITTIPKTKAALASDA